MESLRKHIVDYIQFLNQSYSLWVSVHFSSSIASRIDFKNYADILAVTSHNNPYCINVKSSKELNNKCLACQKKVIAKISTCQSFTGTCHADVLEYIYGVSLDGIGIAFISVSGYKGHTNKLKKNKRLAMIYDNNLSDDPVPVPLLNTIIPPLGIMLEVFCTYVFKEKTPFYSDNFQKILLFVREQYRNVTLENLAREFNYSKSYISHMFKKTSGYSLPEYCNILKIEDAKSLLKSTNFSITEVGLSVGYNDFSYFISVFKRLTGKTPFKWRKDSRKN